MWLVAINGDGEEWSKLYDNEQDAVNFIQEYKRGMSTDAKLYVAEIKHEVGGEIRW
ncbi:hypothetical protein [Sporosarcina sp. FSL W7-1283]|uniref:hypothetical protein n=1 Tax=Sporosarcina sp. FSL W7-1283 TaxID=2921560 RepID=UPI0030FC2742